MKLSKEIIKRIENYRYYKEEDFINDCKEYIKALKAGRLLYEVTHVSSSGMSRDISITAFVGKYNNGYYRSFSNMLETLGYKFSKNSYDIKVSGCGMNMLFATNYNIIHKFYNMKLITKKTCDILAQKINCMFII